MFCKSFLKNNLTPEQKSSAHALIHTSSAICAGISAYIGEACLTGSVFSLICSDLFGDIVNGEIFKEKSKKLIILMNEDPTINHLIEKHLATTGITNTGQIVLGKNTVKNL